MPVYEIQVLGRVQGVGFRYHARECALQLGISGYVKNLADRSVYIVAETQESLIDGYCEMLRRGNGFSVVRQINIEKMDSEYKYHGFEIR
ncbi:MAG: acylphosphatase [Candidatus Cloacimonetes bacterium]|jgi:acylphosphatase|nr:acylphosphatase [Candidatus Cloacimonadota bacterium]MDY0298921.1 acylphosphatase [Candidatus Cloacimonadaceae bacterium]MCB5278537.1 acylphosphatase [Candidatus Cloacimonadota bacterium]MCK9331601.1 acylphosphatase [Candidatus Cloacimonadota bacterium]MDD2210487.1 acylphosphatase [Candidatus Cloacimonadota bacterium]